MTPSGTVVEFSTILTSSTNFTTYLLMYSGESINLGAPAGTVKTLGSLCLGPTT